MDFREIVLAEIRRIELVSPAISVAHWLDDPEHVQLKLALETAAAARSLIGPEQDRLRELLAEATTDVEREAREYQIWYIEKYYNRAADIAERRIAYFKTVDIAAELKRIRTDIPHWFEYYAWGYDPRARTALSTVPFQLFPKQQEMIEWLQTRVFHRRDSGIIEKARDEGATETIVRWGVYHWLFTEGVSGLFSTRKEDEVDSKKNQNTLFERMRFQLRLLPVWQHPEGFDLERGMLGSMKLVNPENGNTLLGEAPVENMGRGGRVTYAVLDEFAFWPFAGYPQFRSLSQTTDSILMPSSVAGRLNQFADIAFDGTTSKFTLDWRDNPFKDKRWYDSLPYGYISAKMSKTTIAQEVDRNYDAAQPGKVWQCKEEYSFITQSEFLKPFAKIGYKFFNECGQFKIPHDWRVVRTHDYGKSEGHDWGYFLAAQPTANYPLNDTHFVFVARNLEPTGILTAEAVQQWRTWERKYGLRTADDEWINKPAASYNSHEQKDLRKVLLESHGEQWEAWQTDYQTGIEQIEEWFEPVDLLEQNPFRDKLYGRTKLVFVAPDNEYSLAFNERLNQWFTTVSESEEGFATLRKQISAYHYPLSELGKAKKDMRPVKEFDDIVDAMRGYAVMWNVRPVALTKVEAFTRELESKGLGYEQIEQIEDETARKARIQRRVLEERAFAQKQDKSKSLPRFMRIGRR